MANKNKNINDPRFIQGNLLCQRLTLGLDRYTVHVNTESALLVAQLESKCVSYLRSEKWLLDTAAKQGSLFAPHVHAATAQLKILRKGSLMLVQLEQPEKEEEVKKEEKLANILLDTETKDLFLLFNTSTFGHKSFKEASLLSRHKLRTALLYRARVLETYKQFSELDDEIVKGMNDVIDSFSSVAATDHPPLFPVKH